MKRRLGSIILLALFAVGLTLLLYPPLSNYWNQRTSSHAIASYTEQIADLDDDTYITMWQSAQAFNQKLLARGGFQLPDEMLDEYNSLLDITGRGIMGYVEIPSLDVSLPMYHGTDEAVLQIAVGHLEWSSLPVGGEGTHVILCGHRGLPSAKLFNDLPKMSIGDLFYIRVLNEMLTYEVDQILTVLPDDMSSLAIEAGKDYCTLLTCTPYGINTHRLLVRGHRIANDEEDQKSVFVASEATIVEPLIVAPIIALPLLFVLLLYLVLRGDDGKRKRNGKEKI